MGKHQRRSQKQISAVGTFAFVVILALSTQNQQCFVNSASISTSDHQRNAAGPNNNSGEF
jgi:hypothetical protein